MDGYIKPSDSPISGLTYCCGYACEFPIRTIPDLIQWVANFRSPFDRICIQSQWRHNFNTGGLSSVTVRIE